MTETLSVLGWERFQHYKDRDPPWVKLYRDLLTTESWVLGTDSSRLVQVASILLAARYSNKIPLDWTLIRKVTSIECSVKQFHESVAHLVKYNFLEIQRCTEQPKVLVQLASTVLDQSREETEKRQSREDNPTAAHAAMTQSDVVAMLDADVENFEAFKLAYPKRNGSQPWIRARRAISARLAEGSSWNEIISGATAYAAWCRATGKENTEFVMQAATFCGPEKRYLDAWPMPATKADVRLAGNVDAAEQARRELFGRAAS